MARLGRYFIEGQPLHVIQRGNDRKPVFFAEDDYAQYRGWLVGAAAANGLKVYSYVLMTNHVHLLAEPEKAESLPRTMQSLGAAMCATSMRSTGERERCGRAATARCRSIRTNTSSPAAATSSSIRCAPAWWSIRASTAGPAIGRMARAGRMHWPPFTPFCGDWDARWKNGRSPTGR